MTKYCQDLFRVTIGLIVFLLGAFQATAQQAPYFTWVKGLQGYNTHPIFGSYSQGNAIRTDKAGNVFVAGKFLRTVDFDPGKDVDSQSGNTYFGGFFAKYDSMGIHQWAKTIPGSEVTSLQVDDSGYIYVGGAYYDTVDFDPGPLKKTLVNHGGTDFFVAKYSSTGELKWVRGSGGSNGDVVHGLVVDNQGGVYVAGRIHGLAVDFNERSPGSVVYQTNVVDGFVAKYDRDGNYVWSKHINGNDGDVAYGIASDATGNLYVCGYSNGAKFDGTPASFAPGRFPGASTHDAFIAKYTSAGAFVWAKTVGSEKEDMAYSIAVDKSGSILLAGYFSDVLVFDSSIAGARIANKSYAGDIFVAKFSNTGSYLWGKGYGGNMGYNKAFTITTDDSSNVYFGGHFSDTVNFNPGGTLASRHISHLYPFDPIRGVDMFMVKLRADGSYAWSKSYGNLQWDEINCIYLDKKYNVYFSGAISKTTDFEPGPGGQVVVNSNSTVYDFPVAVFSKYAQVKPVTAVPSVNAGQLLLHGYPNPANDEVTINGFRTGSRIVPVVTDIAGKHFVLPYTLTAGYLTLQTSALAPGIYFVRCTDESGKAGVIKFLKKD